MPEPTLSAGMGTLLDAIMAGRPSGREGHPATRTLAVAEPVPWTYTLVSRTTHPHPGVRRGPRPRPRARTERHMIHEATIADIHAAYRAGKTTERTVTQHYLHRIAAYDRRGAALGAVILTNPNALATADALDTQSEKNAAGWSGPLHGIPVLVKDNYDVAGGADHGRVVRAHRLDADEGRDRRRRSCARRAPSCSRRRRCPNGHAAGCDNINSVLPGFARNPYNTAYATGGLLGRHGGRARRRLRRGGAGFGHLGIDPQSRRPTMPSSGCARAGRSSPAPGWSGSTTRATRRGRWRGPSPISRRCWMSSPGVDPKTTRRRRGRRDTSRRATRPSSTSAWQRAASVSACCARRSRLRRLRSAGRRHCWSARSTICAGPAPRSSIRSSCRSSTAFPRAAASRQRGARRDRTLPRAARRTGISQDRRRGRGGGEVPPAARGRPARRRPSRRRRTRIRPSSKLEAGRGAHARRPISHAMDRGPDRRADPAGCVLSAEAQRRSQYDADRRDDLDRVRPALAGGGRAHGLYLRGPAVRSAIHRSPLARALADRSGVRLRTGHAPPEATRDRASTPLRRSGARPPTRCAACRWVRAGAAASYDRPRSHGRRERTGAVESSSLAVLCSAASPGRAAGAHPTSLRRWSSLHRMLTLRAQAPPPSRGACERSCAMAFFSSMPDADMKDTLAREPAIGIPFSQLNEAVMRGDAPFSTGERELLAAYVSALNGCDYCQCEHSALATAFGLPAGHPGAAPPGCGHGRGVREPSGPPWSMPGSSRSDPTRLGPADVEVLFAAGHDERALYFLVFVTAVFTMSNRIVQGLGLTTPSPAGLQRSRGASPSPGVCRHRADTSGRRPAHTSAPRDRRA